MLMFIGGTFLIIGAVIGGGILAIPIVSAQFGFATTLLLIMLSWLTMMKTGLYVLSLSLSCPEKYNSYYSIVGKFLGEKAQAITVLLCLWLLYFSLSSYISGSASLLLSHLSHQALLSYFNTCLLFVFLSGALLVVNAKIVVRLNVVLVISKMLLLLLAIGAVLPQGVSVPLQSLSLFKGGAWSLMLVVINAFGFQFIIPSLVSYYGREQAQYFKWMIIVSTSIVLCLYVAWLYTIYAIIPTQGEHGLLAIYQSTNQLLAFNKSLVFYLHSNAVIYLLSTFETVALFGSFFCVSLGLFDFLSDVLKTGNRLIVGLFTFIPPLILTLFSENMYVYAMSAAGYIAIILEIMIPILARFKSGRRASV